MPTTTNLDRLDENATSDEDDEPDVDQVNTTTAASALPDRLRHKLANKLTHHNKLPKTTRKLSPPPKLTQKSPSFDSTAAATAAAATAAAATAVKTPPVVSSSAWASASSDEESVQPYDTLPAHSKAAYLRRLQSLPLPDQVHTATEVEASLHDRLAASALASSWEVLKLAGGLTLSTTGKIVSPSLKVTRDFLLPQLGAATLDLLATNTPQRAKDWLRILKISVTQLFTTLLSNDPEKHQASIAFRERFIVVLVDVLDCLSSDTARQFYTDAVSSVVRFVLALDTPESQSWLDQAAVTTCRLLQVAASSRTQRLVHDVKLCAYKLIELLADPLTVTAVAEVTAYLCHALEMEEAHVYTTNLGNVGSMDQETNGVPPDAAAAFQAQRRRDRQQYQQRMYQDPLLTTDPQATIEEVILSSLGMLADTPETSASSTVTKSTKATTTPAAKTSAPAGGSVASAISSKHTRKDHDDDELTTLGDDEDAEAEQPAWHERAKNEVNVGYLRETIQDYAAHKTARQKDRAAAVLKTNSNNGVDPSTLVETVQENDKTLSDLEDLGRLVEETAISTKKQIQRPKTKLQPATDDDSKRTSAGNERQSTKAISLQESKSFLSSNLSKRLPEETPVDHFYRVLDEVLSQRRFDSMKWAYDGGNPESTAGPGLVNKVSRSAESIKDRWKSLRTSMEQAAGKQQKGRQKNFLWAVKRHGLILYPIMFMMLSVALAWTGFGCYGMYVYLYRSSRGGHSASTSRTLHAGQGLSTTNSQEVVIRIVREIVHVNQKGETIAFAATADGSPAAIAGHSSLSQKEIDKLANCVAQTLN